ncbi:MAG: hypothetical protein CMN00_07245 [Rickettsiales bacterium]|nr:hypothetical protein [Rickettsiales bacterium]
MSNININIITGDEGYGYELFNGFWSPIFSHYELFKNLGIKFRFLNKLSDKSLDADILFLSSRFFKRQNSENYLDQSILKTINKIKEKKRVVWFDLRDSAGTTQFEVLPYVDFYIKKQIYNDLDVYKEDIYGGRMYSDYYNKYFNIQDSQIYKMKKLDIKFKDKIHVGWNIGVRNFKNIPPSRFMKYLSFFNEKYKLLGIKKKLFEFINPDKDRNINLIGSFSKNIDRNSVRFQRELFEKKINRLSLKKKTNLTAKVPIREYYRNLYNAKVLISLYGWGEVCYKEFEASIFGCCFVMPNMSNIITWPNIYKPRVTYLPIKWDLSDINDVVSLLIDNPELRFKLVKNSQEQINSVRNEIGYDYFFKLFKKIIS